ncbi:MAG: hypothetical protein ACLRL4_10550 [Bifidobacterium bifidum]
MNNHPTDLPRPDRARRAGAGRQTAGGTTSPPQAAAGEHARLARRAGAFVSGEKLPYGTGMIAVFDGHHLITRDMNDGYVTARDEFDPASLTVDDDLRAELGMRSVADA